jgi:transcriptional regulator with XRE-family HTH domain
MANGYAPALRLPAGSADGHIARLARLALGLSRADVAKALGISVSTYRHIEEGARAFRLDELRKFVALTGQDIELFGASLSANGTDGYRSVSDSEAVVKRGEAA